MASHPSILDEFPISRPAITLPGTNLQVLANIISAVAYGSVVIISSACVWTLQDTARPKSSTRMRSFLYVYIVLMFALSTMAFIQETIYTTKLIENDIFPTRPDLVTYLTSLGVPLPLPFTILGADGFMMWRCLILYQGMNPLPRYILNVFLGLLTCYSLRSGIAFFTLAGAWESEFSQAILPLIPGRLNSRFGSSQQVVISIVVMICTTCVNIVLSLLIFFRLIYFQRYISKTLGPAHGSPYLKVITMCIESCALMLVFSTANIATIATESTSYLIPFLLFPHICVISPLLIVYRVARGRSANGTTSGPKTRTGRRPVHNTTLRFNQPVTTEENYGGIAAEYELPNNDVEGIELSMRRKEES